MPRISWIRRGIPFGVVDRELAGSPARVLCPFAQHSALTFGQLRFRIVVFVTQGVSWVMMRRHEIDGHATGLTECDKLFNPSIPGRRRSANFERRVDPLDRLRGYAIQLEIVLLAASPKRLQIRFV